MLFEKKSFCKKECMRKRKHSRLVFFKILLKVFCIRMILEKIQVFIDLKNIFLIRRNFLFQNDFLLCLSPFVSDNVFYKNMIKL